jgi:hypothetical protein
MIAVPLLDDPSWRSTMLGHIRRADVGFRAEMVAATQGGALPEFAEQSGDGG